MTPSTNQTRLQQAIAHHQAGRLNEAEAIYRQLLSSSSDDPALLHLLGVLCQQTNRHHQAINYLQHAVSINPAFATAWNNLSVSLLDAGQIQQAIVASTKALAIQPHHVPAHINLAIARHAHGDFDLALIAASIAISLDPQHPDAHAHLAHALKAVGRIDDALQSYKTAIDLRPSDAALHSHYCSSLHFSAAYDDTAIAKELKHWNDRHAAPLLSSILPHANNLNPNRRLRIGYFAPTFSAHSMAHFILPLLRHHDHTIVEVFCYSDVPREDSVTWQIRDYADHWKPIRGMSDSNAATLIRSDQIDILVDLNLHMANNRLLVFARKPAPVQITMLGYPGSTGLETMDYRVTDSHLEPPGARAVFAEQSISLQDSFWCYDPMTDAAPVNPLPAHSNGYITFGCLNHLYKIVPQTTELFARVMRALPSSRLIMLCPSQTQQLKFFEQFQQSEISHDRVHFVGLQDRLSYLRTYHRIDISLDVLPYNGHTTSFDSLWMGVPVISQTGNTIVGRAGVSLLTSLNLQHLLAANTQEYLAIATRISTDRNSLSDLRKTLRQRMLGSRLMDAPRYTRNVESEYRRIWENWCLKNTSLSPAAAGES